MRLAGVPWLLMALSLAFVPLAPAQVPPLDYETTFAGFHLASGHGVTVDADGNAYVIAADYQDTVHLDILVMKLDPDGEILWSEYVIGNGHDFATDIVLNPSRDIYITGFTDSDDFPLVNALDTSLTGFREAFVMKLSGVDGSILYSTYLGGDYVDQGAGIALNDAGEIYLSGTTESSDFPTVNPLQAELRSPSFSDAFVTKLSADGSTILYSTYLGGSRDDAAGGLFLDASGAIYLAGDTDFTDFPTISPIQADFAGGFRDLFVSRISADGQTLDFSSYVGGEDWDGLGGFVVDASGSIYLAGRTRSVTYPTTPGAYQETFAGEIAGCEVPFGEPYNCDDVFLTKLVPGALIFSTYLGGSRVEELRGLAVDGTGSARLVGYTNSPDFPPSGIATAAEIFVSRLNAGGSELVYTFSMFSASAGKGHGAAVDSLGGTYFTGAVEAPAQVYVAKLGDDSAEPARLYREEVLSVAQGWKAAALPLDADNDTEAGGFPVPTPIPGLEEDTIATAAPLVLYRLLLPGGFGAGNVLRAIKIPAGVELSY